MNFFNLLHKRLLLYRIHVYPKIYGAFQILLRRGKYNEAKEFYKQGIFHNRETSLAIHDRILIPEHLGDLHVSLARLYYTQATHKARDPFKPLIPEVEEALKNFREATLVNPDGADGWKGVGFIYEKMGLFKESQAAFKEALRINPNDPEIRPKVSGS